MNAVIFDVDGVLADTEPLHLEAVNAVLAPFEKKLSEEENLEYLGLDECDLWQKLIHRFSLEEDPAELSGAQIMDVCRRIREGIVPMPGVPEFITGLAMRGLPMAAATSSPRPVVEAILEELGLGRTFKAVIDGGQVEQGKPEPDIFLKAADALGVPPDECMVIEDSPKGIEGAVRAGMYVVAVQNRYNFNLDLSRANRIFSGLERFDWTLFEER